MIGSQKADSDMPKMFTIELSTRMFVEDFDEIKKCRECKACLTNTYSLPMHKNMIDEYIPDAPTSLSEIYCQILRNIKDISMYDSFDHYLEDQRQNDPNATVEHSLNILKFKDNIKSYIEQELRKKGDIEEHLIDEIEKQK